MSVKEEIDKLWNQAGLPLEKFYEGAIELLKKGLEEGQEVPDELLVETIVSANTSVGFGGAFDEAKFLFRAFSKVIKTEKVSEIPKIHRLACLLISVTLTLLSVDEVSTKKELRKILKHINIGEDSSRIDVLKSLFYQMEKLLQPLTPDYWSLEFLSFMTMLYTYIEEFGEVGEKDKQIFTTVSELHHNWNEEDQSNLTLWKDRWLEANDYFRLNGMMIFAKAPRNEDSLVNKLKEIYHS